MKQVRVTYHHEDETWWADSPDVEGYVAAGGTLDEARAQVAEGLPFFLDDEVEILETPSPLPSWLKVVDAKGSIFGCSNLAEVSTWARIAHPRVTKDVVHYGARRESTAPRRSRSRAARG